MFKRMALALVVILLTSAAPLAAATPADRTADTGRALDEVVQRWAGWLRLIGIDFGGERGEKEEPRSISDEDDNGPHHDPHG